MAGQNRISKLNVCISATSLCETLGGTVELDEFVTFFVTRAISSVNLDAQDEYSWTDASNLSSVLNHSLRCAYLVEREQFFSIPEFGCYRGDTVATGFRPTYIDLLRYGSMYLPIGVSQNSHPVSAQNILSFQAAPNVESGRSCQYSAFRTKILRVCNRVAGYASRPAVDTTYMRVRFEPGLEAYMSQCKDFVEFLK